MAIANALCEDQKKKYLNPYLGKLSHSYSLVFKHINAVLCQVIF